jgi:hypothetical protein
MAGVYTGHVRWQQRQGKFQPDLVRAEVKKGKCGTEPAYHYTFGRENTNRHLGTVFPIYNKIILVVKRIEFVSDRLLYLILKYQLLYANSVY